MWLFAEPSLGLGGLHFFSLFVRFSPLLTVFIAFYLNLNFFSQLFMYSSVVFVYSTEFKKNRRGGNEGGRNVK
jgi:hypothetical protein